MNRVIAALLAGSAIVAAAPVLAADLPEPVPVAPVAEPYVEATAFDWTGAYIGGAVGYGFADYSATSTLNGSGSSDVDDFTAGLFAGYNYAFTPQWVVGAEVDVYFAPEQDFALGGTTYNADSQFLSTLRGRVGYAFGNFMVYGTGGLALGMAEVTSSAGGSDDATHLGYTVGAGLEAALTQNITARVEYNYLDLGSETYDLGADSLEADLDAHMVKVGVAYKF